MHAAGVSLLSHVDFGFKPVLAHSVIALVSSAAATLLARAQAMMFNGG